MEAFSSDFIISGNDYRLRATKNAVIAVESLKVEHTPAELISTRAALAISLYCKRLKRPWPSGRMGILLVEILTAALAEWRLYLAFSTRMWEKAQEMVVERCQAYNIPIAGAALFKECMPYDTAGFTPSQKDRQCIWEFTLCCAYAMPGYVMKVPHSMLPDFVCGDQFDAEFKKVNEALTDKPVSRAAAVCKASRQIILLSRSSGWQMIL